MKRKLDLDKLTPKVRAKVDRALLGKTETIFVRVTPEKKEQYEKAAKRSRSTLSEWMREALDRAAK